MNKLIGLSGAAGSGKDTAGNYLSWLLGYETYALASPIKSIVNTLFGWDDRHSFGELKEVIVKVELAEPEKVVEVVLLIAAYLDGIVQDKAGAIAGFFDLIDTELADSDERVSPRRLYQIVGTEWGRSVDTNLWLKMAEQKLAASDGLIITDVRFPNEAEWVEDKGGVQLHVERKGVAAVSTHSSENGLPDSLVDFYIPNNGSIQDLQEYLLALAKGVGVHAIETK
jgi:hypothetical protein